MVADLQTQDVTVETIQAIVIVLDAELLHVGGGSTSGCLV